MATASCLLSEDKFLCSVCLDVFSEPVSTPCGHNFCSKCIHKFWDSSDICKCPLCNRRFSTRPELHINTVMCDLAAEFKKFVKVKEEIPDSDICENAGVLCDICSGMTEKAVKSCLMCLASFCKTHLEPHERVAGLRGHTLIDPVDNLIEKLCKEHNKLSELYCRTDHACICVMCFKTSHKNHSVVPLEEEYEAVMATKDDAMENIRKMIKSRSEKIAEIEKSLDVSEKKAEKEKEETVQVFTDLIHFVQRRQRELVEVIEEKHRATMEESKGLIEKLNLEITELERRSSKLENISLSADHHHFLQSFPSLTSLLNEGWTYAAFNLDFKAEREAVTLVKQKVDEIMEKVPEIKMRTVRKHAVDLTFDPDTANYFLDISPDGKQVMILDEPKTLPSNSKRFVLYKEVLAKQGFTTGQFYYEVQVAEIKHWIIGVARESVDRTNDTHVNSENGFWAIGIEASDGEGICRAFMKNFPKITRKKYIQRVGVYGDYDKRVISFYDVDSTSHMFSFKDCYFNGRLYPYFYLQGKRGETNPSITITTLVPHKD